MDGRITCLQTRCVIAVALSTINNLLQSRTVTDSVTVTLQYSTLIRAVSIHYKKGDTDMAVTYGGYSYLNFFLFLKSGLFQSF